MLVQKSETRCAFGRTQPNPTTAMASIQALSLDRVEPSGGFRRELQRGLNCTTAMRIPCGVLRVWAASTRMRACPRGWPLVEQPEDVALGGTKCPAILSRHTVP